MSYAACSCLNTVNALWNSPATLQNSAPASGPYVPAGAKYQSQHDACYNCLSWALPNNTDGSMCVKCAKLAANTDTKLIDPANLGSAATNAARCFNCTVDLGGLCTGQVTHLC